MKLYLNFLFIFCFGLSLAQNKEFTYEYQFISDSTNRKDVSTEIMILNIDKEKSHYYSFDKYISDSTIIAETKKNFRTGDQIIREQRKMMLEKISKDNNIIEIDILKRESESKSKK